VGLRAPAVVRLVGALAHVKTPSSCSVQRASLQDATLAERGGATARPYAGPTGRSTTRRTARRQVGPDCTYAAGKDSLDAQNDRCRRLRGWTAVEGMAAALLACPFAGLQRHSHTALN
jgi:hypothetical protein